MRPFLFLGRIRDALRYYSVRPEVLKGEWFGERNGWVWRNLNGQRGERPRTPIPFFARTKTTQVAEKTIRGAGFVPYQPIVIRSS